MSEDGLLAGIDDQSSLRQRRYELLHVAAHVGPAVALRQGAGDLFNRALAVAQLQHRHRRGIEAHGALRNEQHVLLTHLVVAQPGAGGQTRVSHCGAPGPGGWLSPRSMASSWAHRSSVLNRSAATADSCCSRVTQRSTTRSSAYWASRGALTSRVRKYSSPAGSIHG